MLLIELLSAILIGAAGSAAHDSAKTTIKTAWQRFARKNLDDLYLDALDSAARELKLLIGPNYLDNEPGIDREYFRGQLSQHINLPEAAYLDLQDEGLLQLLIGYISQLPIMYFDNRIPFDQDGSRLATMFVDKAKGLFKERVIGNEREFRQVILEITTYNHGTLRQIENILQVQFDLQIGLLEKIDETTAEIQQDIKGIQQDAKQLVQIAQKEGEEDKEIFEEYLQKLDLFCANFPDLSIRNSVSRSLDEVFVEPMLGIPIDKRRSVYLSKRELKTVIEQVFSGRSSKHLFIRSRPGSGKSTLLRRITKYAWNDPSKVGLEGSHIPLIVRLQHLAMTKGVFDEDSLINALNKADDLVLHRKIPAGL